MHLTTLAKVAVAAKVIELVIAIACMALYEHSLRLPHTSLMPAVFGGYIIILPVAILGTFTEQRIGRLLDLIWTAAGLGLFLAAGGLAINYHFFDPTTHLAEGAVMGCLAVGNALIFLLDLIVTCKDVSEYASH